MQGSRTGGGLGRDDNFGDSSNTGGRTGGGLGRDDTFGDTSNTGGLSSDTGLGGSRGYDGDATGRGDNYGTSGGLGADDTFGSSTATGGRTMGVSSATLWSRPSADVF